MFFISGATLGKNYDIDLNTQRVIAFNSQFEKYVNTTKKNGSKFVSKGNLPSDVISCANLAYNINRKNEFDSINKVDVEVICGGTKYTIQPKEEQKNNEFYEGKSFFSFLEDYNEIKISEDTNETIYKYYFDVGENGIHYSGVTGKVDKITFTAIGPNF